MSRLYDRVLVHGCRPFPFWDLFTGYTKDQAEAGFDPDLSAKMLLREEGREATPEAIAELAKKLRHNTQHNVRSNARFRHTEIAGSTVLLANDAGHYFDSFPEGIHMGDLLSTVAPPLRDMWIEFEGVPNRLHLRSWGVHLGVADGPGVDVPLRPAWVPGEARWVVAFTIVGEWTKNDIVGQIAHGAICLDAEGSSTHPSPTTGSTSAPRTASCSPGRPSSTT